MTVHEELILAIHHLSIREVNGGLVFYKEGQADLLHLSSIILILQLNITLLTAVFIMFSLLSNSFMHKPYSANIFFKKYSFSSLPQIDHHAVMNSAAVDEF